MSDLGIPIQTIPLPMTPATQMLLDRQVRSDGVKSDQETEDAAKAFESVLIYKLMEEMSRSVPDSGLLGDGISKQVQGMFWFFLSQEVAQQGGLGLWKDIQSSMKASGQTEQAGPRVEVTR